MKNILILIYLCIGPGLSTVSGQPLFDTYVPNKYVEENSFLGRTADTSMPPEFSEIKGKLPAPH